MFPRIAVSLDERWVIFLCSLGLLLDAPATALAGERSPAKPAAEGLTQSQRDAMKWFDGLGFPDLKGRQLVRVATGQWSRSDDNPPENTYFIAFLLKTEGDQFTVMGANLDTRTFKATPPGAPPWRDRSSSGWVWPRTT